jgi:hypothetical protein
MTSTVTATDNGSGIVQQIGPTTTNTNGIFTVTQSDGTYTLTAQSGDFTSGFTATITGNTLTYPLTVPALPPGVSLSFPSTVTLTKSGG